MPFTSRTHDIVIYARSILQCWVRCDAIQNANVFIYIFFFPPECRPLSNFFASLYFLRNIDIKPGSSFPSRNAFMIVAIFIPASRKEEGEALLGIADKFSILMIVNYVYKLTTKGGKTKGVRGINRGNCDTGQIWLQYPSKIAGHNNNNSYNNANKCNYTWKAKSLGLLKYIPYNLSRYNYTESIDAFKLFKIKGDLDI